MVRARRPAPVLHLLAVVAMEGSCAVTGVMPDVMRAPGDSFLLATALIFALTLVAWGMNIATVRWLYGPAPSAASGGGGVGAVPAPTGTGTFTTGKVRAGDLARAAIDLNHNGTISVSEAARAQGAAVARAAVWWFLLFAFVTNDVLARRVPRVVLLPLAALVVAVVVGRAAWLEATVTVEDQKAEAVRQFRAAHPR